MSVLVSLVHQSKLNKNKILPLQLDKKVLKKTLFQ